MYSGSLKDMQWGPLEMCSREPQGCVVRASWDAERGRWGMAHRPCIKDSSSRVLELGVRRELGDMI